MPVAKEQLLAALFSEPISREEMDETRALTEAAMEGGCPWHRLALAMTQAIDQRFGGRAPKALLADLRTER